MNLVFIYAKDKEIIALDHEDAKMVGNGLISKGYKHTATIEARVLIQYLANANQKEQLQVLKDLRYTLSEREVIGKRKQDELDRSMELFN
jgi:hypothetical protein